MPLTTFYYLRHGQTEANRQGLMCGASWDIELNSAGVAEAERAAEILHAHVGSVHEICTSPLVRARRTAEIVASRLEAPIRSVTELREWDIGGWDRLPFEQVKSQFLGTAEPEGGETRAMFGARVRDALDKCGDEADPLLIVSHGAVWLALQAQLGIPPVRAGNGIPLRVSMVNGRWEAAAVEHLADW